MQFIREWQRGFSWNICWFVGVTVPGTCVGHATNVRVALQELEEIQPDDVPANFQRATT
jgi:hypothetical protein